MPIKRIVSLVTLCWLLQACVSVGPEQTQNEKASAVNVQLGIGYLQQNKLELANEKLSKALRQDPDSAAAHNAYAILQERLLQPEKAEYHYARATELDPKDSQAANNYGAYLCRNGREYEAEKYFRRAVDNPLYKTPEFAYTNAAICLLKVNERGDAENYLRKALAAKSDFAPALLAMGDMAFEDGKFENAKLYVDRYHLTSRPTSRSLWLAIRATLEIDPDGDVGELGERLETEFPNSSEARAWAGIK